jgi:Bardet-Biedl syndrome 9 protein
MTLNTEVEKSNEKYKVQVMLDRSAPSLPAIFPGVTHKLSAED